MCMCMCHTTKINTHLRLILNALSLITEEFKLLFYDIICLQGIPIIYYGTEQAFHGTDDPNDRESLWPYYNTNR